MTEYTNEEHHAHPAIGSSDIKLMKRSPLHYWYRKHCPEYEAKPASNAMRMGTALHMALLEPDLFDKAVGAELAMPKTSNAAKAAHAAHNAQYELTVTAADYQKVLGMRDAALRHPILAKITRQVAYREVSLFSECPVTGLPLKIRPDALTTNGWLLDVKTTSDARDSKFKWSVRDYGYDGQAAHYLTVLRQLPPEALPALQAPIQGQLICTIENEAPYATRVIRIPDRVINMAAADNLLALERIRECTDMYGTETPWPPYEQSIVELDY